MRSIRHSRQIKRSRVKRETAGIRSESCCLRFFIINSATANIKDSDKDYPEKNKEIAGDVRRLNPEKISEEEDNLNNLRNIFLTMLKDIKTDYDNTPKDISCGGLKKQLTEIKSQSDKVQLSRKLFEEEIADIVIFVLTGLEVADLDETETQIFYKIA